MYDIYLTSTFTKEWNRVFGPRLGEALEKKGIKCFLPYRDTNQKGEPKERFEQDIEGINNSHSILAVAINESPNWGGRSRLCLCKGGSCNCIDR